MAFLADDELHGRGSGTRDEHLSRPPLYAASRFEALGLEPGGDNGTFLQKSPLPPPAHPACATPNSLPHRGDPPRKETRNAVRILRGATAPTLEVILLSAHLDHLPE